MIFFFLLVLWLVVEFLFFSLLVYFPMERYTIKMSREIVLFVYIYISVNMGVQKGGQKGARVLPLDLSRHGRNDKPCGPPIPAKSKLKRKKMIIS